MNNGKVVIIIPTYNEALVIEETLHRVFEAIIDIPKTVQVLVFDSGSTDKTQAIVKTLQRTYQSLLLKTEPQKSGLGAAYLQAMRYALDELSADIVMEYDADLSHQPKYIAPMLETLDTCDVVVGSRYVKGGCIPDDWGVHRKFLSVMGNLVARFFLTPRYRDFTSGFRASRREVLLKTLPTQFLSNHYAYKLQLLWSLHKNKAKIAEYPIVFVDRAKGHSKLPANSILDSLRVLMLLRLHELQRYFSMCAVGASGMMIQCLVYNVLRHNISPVNATQFAVLAAIVNNFTLNNRFTFKRKSPAKSGRKIKSFFSFAGYTLVMIGLQSYWLQLGLRYLGSGYLRENICILTGIAVGSIFNYLIYSRLIWTDKNAYLTLGANKSQVP
ncbi:glycosyltransferase family 2 protein [Legionella spiritensis]|uniref:Glycosyltransferase n=1 Tax=Legionella spiritensis TaxID=452 RepID=A0A0W0YXJ4_LEGSP|nr:glycosyltransferase family 2 protein [Legionella spiritensis]KTD61593.1 glycosyltransferase [Legionella spiritensis]SNV39526.1 glycosyltransferase [Legionella spiritensis]